MIIFIVIISIICLLSIIVLGLTKDDRDGFMITLGIFIITLFLLIIGLILSMRKSNVIPAIEVYRGNTTLQITYQDSIPIDSVVVYKNK